jgi:hypothetical protein
MNNNLTEIWMILDRSGSMESIHSGTVEAVNSFVKNQKKEEGEAVFTLRQFDDEVLTTYDRIPLGKVPMMKLEDFQPRASTALYDAVGSAINDLGNILKNTPEAKRPGQVVFTILTDGMENASKEFSGKKVADMIAHQKSKYGWEFFFLGADFNVDEVADALNVSAGSRQTYQKSHAGVKEAMMLHSYQVSEVRKKQKRPSNA